MAEENEEPRLPEIEALRAPPRPDIARLRARGRILAAAEPLLARRRRSGSSLDVLAAWSKAGLVAAAIALAALVGALQLGGGPETAEAPLALEDLLTVQDGRNGVPALLLAVTEPDADAVVAAAFQSNPNGGTRR